MSIEHDRVGAAMADRTPQDILRSDLTPEQREEIRRAAQADRYVVRCQATGSRCRTDGDGYVGTFVTSDAAHDAIEEHEHPARIVGIELAYVAVCLTDGCGGIERYEWQRDAEAACAAHDANLGHDPVFGRASQLVDDIDGGAA